MVVLDVYQLSAALILPVTGASGGDVLRDMNNVFGINVCCARSSIRLCKTLAHRLQVPVCINDFVSNDVCSFSWTWRSGRPAFRVVKCSEQMSERRQLVEGVDATQPELFVFYALHPLWCFSSGTSQHGAPPSLAGKEPSASRKPAARPDARDATTCRRATVSTLLRLEWGYRASASWLSPMPQQRHRCPAPAEISRPPGLRFGQDYDSD